MPGAMNQKSSRPLTTDSELHGMVSSLAKETIMKTIAKFTFGVLGALSAIAIFAPGMGVF